MRSFIAALVIITAMPGVAIADPDQRSQKVTSEHLFSDDGIYIAPGESQEIEIAGDCRLLTNRDPQMGYFITPARHSSWQEVWIREPREPIVTEVPCE